MEVAFGIADYVVFALTLGLSAGIGLYFACFTSKQNSTDEYLYGSKNMKAIPVGLSLFSSAMSAATIIGVPGKIYTYGTQYAMSFIGILIGIFAIWYLFLPIFCGNISFKTPYEYFERRFDNSVKYLQSFIYIVQTIIMMPLILYAPSIAVSQATHINIFICTTTIGAFCIIYTTFGGFKTVIWTDTLQATVMLGSCLLIMIIGVNIAGGFPQMWAKAEQGGRIEFFDFDPNPFTKITFWSSSIGIIFFHIAHCGCSAGALQRYMSLPSQRDAKLSTFIGGSAIILIQGIAVVIGLIIYAVHVNCDPIKNKEIKSANELMSYFVTKEIRFIPGFSGLFFAGLLSGALSTLSSELNSVGAIVYYDFIIRYFRNNFVKTNGTLIIKFIIIVNGILYLVISPFLNNANHLFELIISFGSITYGAKTGSLFLGILFPKANSKGVIWGSLSSMAIMIWINIGAYSNRVTKLYELNSYPGNCTVAFNTTAQSAPRNESDIFILFRMSYLYYALFGTIITIGIGLIVSYITGPNKTKDMDYTLIAPFLRPYVKKFNKPDIEM